MNENGIGGRDVRFFGVRSTTTQITSFRNATGVAKGSAICAIGMGNY